MYPHHDKMFYAYSHDSKYWLLKIWWFHRYTVYDSDYSDYPPTYIRTYIRTYARTYVHIIPCIHRLQQFCATEGAELWWFHRCTLFDYAFFLYTCILFIYIYIYIYIHTFTSFKRFHPPVHHAGLKFMRWCTSQLSHELLPHVPGHRLGFHGDPGIVV